MNTDEQAVAGVLKNYERALNASTPEANQELFVFQRTGGDWKIARYCFSTINPLGRPA